jgi:hypothetical protein
LSARIDFARRIKMTWFLEQLNIAIFFHLQRQNTTAVASVMVILKQF